MTLPESITEIEYQAFNGCSSLKSIDLPSQLTKLGDGVFSYCSSLQEIEIPEGVSNITNKFCWYCSNLQTVVLPSSIRKMNEYAFNGCPSLVKVVSHISAEDLMTIVKSVFGSSTYANATLLVPKGAVPTYQEIAAWKNFVNIKEQFLLGDVNEDGRVDIGDVVATVNYVLGNVPDVFNLDAADVDESGEINISDVVGIGELGLGE